MNYLIDEQMRNNIFKVLGAAVHPNCSHDTITNLRQQLGRLPEGQPIPKEEPDKPVVAKKKKK